jgi:hypothetical protein
MAIVDLDFEAWREKYAQQLSPIYANIRGIWDVARSAFIAGKTAGRSLQREAAGDGEGGGISSIIHEVGQAIFLLPSGAGSVRDRLDTAMGLLRELSTAPRPTGAEDGEGWRTCRCGVGSIHYQKDCTNPASAEPTDFARGLAEHDAKLTGTGFLVDGGYVTPDRVQVITPNPDARGGGEADDDDESTEPTALQIAYARGYGDGVKHAESLSHPTPAALDAEKVRTMVRDAIVEEVLSHPDDAVVDGPDFADAVLARFDAARATTGGNGNG